MEKERLQIGILYLSFHNSLKKVFNRSKVVTKKELQSKLGRQFLVPKPLRVLAIKELVNMNLLKKESENQFKILDYELNIEEDTGAFFNRINIFSIF